MSGSQPDALTTSPQPPLSYITFFKKTGAVGFEPTPKVLETFILPLNYAPIKSYVNKNWWWGADSNCRTHRERIYSPPRLATSLPHQVKIASLFYSLLSILTRVTIYYITCIDIFYVVSGASNQNRTGDLFLTMEALYLLSYGSIWLRR